MAAPDPNSGRENQDSPGGARWSMVVPRARALPRPRANHDARDASGPARLPSVDAARALTAEAASKAHLRFSPATARHSADAWRAVRFVVLFTAVIVAVAFWTISRLPRWLESPSLSFSSAKGRDWARLRVPRVRANSDSQGLTLYTPFASQSDYRMQFAWQVDNAGVACVFRARDAQNYHVAKLRLVPGGVTVERFGVLHGVAEEPLIEMITFERRDPKPEVAIEAIGPLVSLYLQNELIDTWRDQTLDSGAVGFIEGRLGKAPAEAIRLTLLSSPSHPSATTILRNLVRATQDWWNSAQTVLSH